MQKQIIIFFIAATTIALLEPTQISCTHSITLRSTPEHRKAIACFLWIMQNNNNEGLWKDINLLVYAFGKPLPTVCRNTLSSSRSSGNAHHWPLTRNLQSTQCIGSTDPCPKRRRITRILYQKQ